MSNIFMGLAAGLVLASSGAAYASQPSYGAQLAAADASVTADQAGRIVLQDGQAIGTLSEVNENENLAVISMMDGSEKQVSLSDLTITADGSVALLAIAPDQDSPAY